MSKRPKVKQSRRAGFVLVEVLAALTIALILFAVLSEGFSTVWSRARRPAETTWALALARRVATAIRSGADLDSGDVGNFHYETDIEPLTIEPHDTDLPPAPAALSDAVETTDAKPRPGVLELIVVTVTSPFGHSYRYETIRLKVAQNEN
jgi:prepilin-type N-terminal cleavage/methylation domain-containing protein